jgi:hypothetical protein
MIWGSSTGPTKPQHFNQMMAMEPKKKTNKELNDESGTPVDYFNRIIYWELEEGLWYTPGLIEEQLASHEKVIGTERHGLLVNATFNAVINLECLEHLIKHESPYRNAVAIVTGENLATFLMVKFYMSTMRVERPVKLFKSKESARVWLMEQNLETDQE